jgi:putative metallohydrolase (TIGR04338 family)
MQTQDPRVDRSRGAVYQAEDTVAGIMRRQHRVVRVGAEVLTLPAELQFGTLAGVQGYVDRVLGEPRTTAQYPGRGSVTVVARRGFRAATYSAGVIQVPAADPRGRWALTRTVVLHEVAHHLAGVPGHGPEFRRALIHLYEVHLGPAADLLRHLFEPIDALPDADVVGSAPASSGGDVQVRRVAALLAKATSTHSADEAEAYLAKAAMVAQRHSIDLAVAAMADDAARREPTHRMVTIGEPRRALNKILVSLYLQIARPWSVTVDIGHGSTYVLGYGMPSDLDQVESVFATASTLMLTRAHEHVRAGGWKGSTYLPDGSRTPRPVTAAVARNAFCLGFIERLGQRLREAATQARGTPADTGGTGRTPGGGAGSRGGAMAQSEGGRPGPASADDRVALALRERDRAVTEYHRRASRARGSWRGSASAAGSAAASRRAGRRAAEEYGRRGIGGGGREIGP